MTPLLNVALPVFGIILAGWIAGRFGLLGENSSEALNSFVYWIALPALLFGSMAKVPAADVLNGPFLLAFAGGFAAVFLFALAVAKFVFPARFAVRTLHALCAVFSNTGYMGIPLFLTAFGPERLLPAIIGAVFNASFATGLAVVMIEIDLSDAGRVRHVARDALLALVKSPLVVAPVLGFLLSALGMRLPVPLDNFCSLIGAAAGPCALFALGLFMVGKPITEHMGEILWLSVLKLVGQPLATWIIAVPVLHMDRFWAASAVLLAALPTGALVFTLAQNYGLYVQRASTATLVTTVLSVVTVTAVLLLLPP